MDIKTIKCAAPPEIVSHLKAAQQASGEQETTDQLIELVDRGSLTPFVFTLWLSVSSSPDTLVRALTQEISVVIRFAAIKILGKCLCSSQWEETWDGLGGVAGFLNLFRNFSELEVKCVCRVIGFSAKGDGQEEKKKSITELYRALQPRIFATPHMILDERPLQKHYQSLLSACTEDMIDRVVNDDLGLVPSGHWLRLLETQPITLQAEAIKYALNDQGSGGRWLKPLLSQYPSTATHIRGVSSSMLFSLNVLRDLVKHGKSSLRGEDLEKDLIHPLLRRALKKRVSWQIVEEIVRLSVVMLERSSLVKDLSYGHGGILHMIAQCWSHEPELFKRDFKFLLISSSKRYEGRNKHDLIGLMVGIPRNKRYAMLEFCFNTIGRDLQNAKHLKDDFGVIEKTLLTSLPAEVALDLFIRLRSAKGDENLVDSTAPFSSGGNGEPDLWHTILLQRTGRQKDAEELASTRIQLHKQAALTGATPALRATHTKSVTNYAIASGSLDIYRKELLWARRYIRDPLVVGSLWGSHAREAKFLLAGVPENHLLKDGISIYELRERISSANQILRELFETAFLALREPSFNKRDWQGTIHLPFLLVQERIGRVPDLKNRLGFSDRKIYDIMWRDTLETLISLEKEVLAPGRERLCANSLGGILNAQRMEPIFLDEVEPCTHRFFDQLAKARNELWKEFRPTIYPEVTTLSEPFPRGLPIQHLTDPFVLRTSSLEEYAPYIASRVKDAVFPDPKVALNPIPMDKASKLAIGCFVDDYVYALSVYIPEFLDEQTKRQRVEKAWTHAVGPLSSPRFTPEEARRYWGKPNRFDTDFPKSWPLRNLEIATAEDRPTVPEVDDPFQMEEWNPVPPKRSSAKSRKVTNLAYVDLLKAKHSRTSWPTVKSKMFDGPVSVPGEKADYTSFWTYQRLECARDPSNVREGRILCALLYLDTFNAAHTRILSKPFPSFDSISVRFPALYFDGDWLAKTELQRYWALSALRSDIRYVPPALLAQVAVNTVDQYNATEPDTKDYSTLEYIAMDLIKILGESDRPALASRLAIRCILDRPDASSWHRQILSIGFLKRLPAGETGTCIQEFAAAIITKLEAQRKKSNQEYSEDTSPEQYDDKMADDKMKPPFVKITTVKHLTELLRGTSFVPEDLSFTILSNLMGKASHMDIRRAVVSSLLKTLRAPSISSDTIDKIISALKAAVPLAGNMRERNPISASEWEEAEELLRIPEITNINYDPDSIPMLTLLLEFLEPKSSYNKGSDAYQGPYVTRTILPILDSLKQQTAKWTSVFLRRQGIPASDIPELNIPPVPLDKRIVEEVLKSSIAYVPLSLLEEYMAYLNFNIAPPAPIAELNNKLRADPALRSSNAVKFWLSRYGRGFEIINHGPRPAILLSRLLLDPLQLENNITPVHIQQQILKLLTLVLWHDGDDLSNVDEVMSSLWATENPTDVDKNWAKHHKPIVEAAIVYIEGLRSRDWERASDEERKPGFLPDTFEYRMWLLQYACRFAPEAQPPLHTDPASAPQDEAPKPDLKEVHIAHLATRIRTITDSMAGTMYHEKFARLKEALRYLGDEGDEKLRVALVLGDIKKTKLSWLSKQDLLRVDVAAGLIGSVEARDGEIEKQVGRMLGEWKRCESEGVRRLGVKMLKMRRDGVVD